MGSTDKRIDDYVNNAADFAQPILSHFRKLVHQQCPGVEETMKWSFPHFVYKGILCSMAAFKQHCSFGFWKSSLMHEKPDLERVTSMKEIPADKKIIAAIREAMLINEKGIKIPKKAAKPIKKEPPLPPELKNALSKNKEAQEAFKNFSPSHRKEYAQWIAEAKTEVTRTKRVETTIEWLTKGKSRHWQYQK